MAIAAFYFTCVLLLNWSPASAAAPKSSTSFLRLSKSFGRYYCSTDKVVFKENGYFSGLQCAWRCSRSPACYAGSYAPEEHTCNGCGTEFEIGNGEMLPSYQYQRQFNFKLVREHMKAADAKINCEELGGRLAAITSEGKLKAVVELLVGEKMEYIYIGGNDIEKEEKFNDPFPGQKCIVLRRNGKRQLTDYYCGRKRLSLCEFS